MPELRLLNAERTREKLTVSQERHIRKLYRGALAEVQEWSKRLEGRDNISSILRCQYLDKMEKELTEAMEHIGSETEKLIRSNISVTATAVVKDANRMLNNMGIGLSTAYSFVPADVVQAITMGKIYDGDWTLSKAIWSNTKKSQQDIHDIIAKGVLENKSSYDIAKDLEKYVNPSAAKPWDWGKIYPGVRKKVDYNAQRLARTLVSHAYQQSFVRTTKDNPFFEGYKWLTANNHRVCPICQGYAEDIHADGLPAGVFTKDDLPLDHPNGQCTLSVYMTQDTDQIVDSLLHWAHGGENAELDKFAESLGFSIPKVRNSIESYKYHATTTSAISGIIEKGLKPNRGHLGNAVYFANSVEDALEWTASTSTGGRTVLRVTEKYLKKLGYEEYSASESGYDLAEGLAYGIIPWTEIQAKYGEEWMSLAKYAEQRKNLVYNKLSSSAKKKVDKQVNEEWKKWLNEHNK